jgi:hypothetical protein
VIRSLLPLLLGTIFGVIVGAGGMLAYQHFAGSGRELMETRGNLAAVTGSAATEKAQVQTLRDQIKTQTEHIEQLQKDKKELAAKLEQASPATKKTSAMSKMIASTMANQREKELLALKTRLQLTPEQEALLKKIIEEEAAQTNAMTEKMMKGEKVDLSSAKNMKSLEQELEKILTPEQKTEYEALKEEEKKNRMETMATFEMNQVAPMLGLNEEQKDQFFNAIYQAEQTLQDPEWTKKNRTGDSKDPLSHLKLRQQAKKEAAAKVLTPEQLDTYSKQLQSEYEMQKAMIEFMPAAAK